MLYSVCIDYLLHPSAIPLLSNYILQFHQKKNDKTKGWCVCVYLCICVYLCVCLCVCVCVHGYMHVCVCVSVSICLSVSVSVSVYMHVCVCMSVYVLLCGVFSYTEIFKLDFTMVDVGLFIVCVLIVAWHFVTKV